MIRQIIVYTPIYVSFFWSLIFLTGKFSNNKARYWLGIFMLVVALLYSCHAGFFLGYSDYYLKIDSLYLLLSLSVYPLYYLYVRLLAIDSEPRWNYIVHFFPPVFLAIVLFLLNTEASFEEKQVYYSQVLIKNRWPDNQLPDTVQFMAIVFYISRIFFGFQVVSYLIAGYLLAKKYDHRIADFYSNLEGKQLIWVKLLTISFLLTSISSLLVNVIGRGLFMNNDLILAIPSLLFSTLFFIIGLQGNKQNYAIHSFLEDERKSLNDLDEPKNLLQNDALKENLTHLMESKQIYLENELKITDLCKELNTNRTYLSNLINKEFNLNFNDLINTYRIKHAVSLIENKMNDSLSLTNIAFDSGFGSLSSFNRAFKKVKGVSPGQYRNKKKIVLQNDKFPIRQIADPNI